MIPFKVLITSTSLIDCNGSHHQNLMQTGWDISFARGPLNEQELNQILFKNNFSAIICGDDEFSERNLRLAYDNGLRFLSKYGVGLDKIDLTFAKKIGVHVKNCSAINSRAVAEHALSIIFCSSKLLYEAYSNTKNGLWDRTIGNMVQGKSLGIIGMGSIGKELASLALLIGMDVKFYDPYVNEYENIRGTTIENIMDQSDFISLHVPLTEETFEFIGEELLERIKPNARLINTARANLINKALLMTFLEKRKDVQYFTDVLWEEPMKDDNLIGISNTFISPHIGSRVSENIVNQANQAIENLKLMINER